MITNRTLFILIVIVYFVADFFFNEAMLYIMGGAILCSLHELFNKKIAILPYVLIWIALLIGFIILFYRLRNKPLKFFILVIIAALLYVADFILYDMLPYDVANLTTKYITIALTILIKNLFLYLIIYYDKNQRILIAKPQ